MNLKAKRFETRMSGVARLASMAILMALVSHPLPVFAQGDADKIKISDPNLSDEPKKENVNTIPGFEPKALADFRGKMPFKSIDFPAMIKADEATFMEDSDYVLGFSEDGMSRAYPLKMAWFHHVINDKIVSPGGKESFFAISYCSVCNTGIRYDSNVNGKPILLDFYGLYYGVVALCDRDTESVWLQASGIACKGARAGSKLTTRTLLNITWARWKALHPDTQVMSQETPFKKYYANDKRGYPTLPGFFLPTITRVDPRLPFTEMVLGVIGPDVQAAKPSDTKSKTSEKSDPQKGTIEKAVEKDSATNEPPLATARAYSLKTLKEQSNVVNDTLSTTPLVVFFDEEGDTAAAYSRELDGKLLTFEAKKLPSGKVLLYDRETGSRWNIEGKSEEGKLMGKKLSPLLSHLSEWYGWAGYFPQTSVFGKNEPPNSQKFNPQK